MTDVTADVIADAFGFAPPIGELALIRQRGAVAAWRVDTGAGAILVKRFWHEDELPWREQLEQAMEFEQLAVRRVTSTADTAMNRFGKEMRICRQ